MARVSFLYNWAFCVICGCSAAFLSGCQTSTHAGAGALAGAGLGGTMGAIIGSGSNRAGSGAVLGALAGATIGGLAGEAEDAREERDAAIAQAQYERSQTAARQAITNHDLITMAQGGLSDQVIINSVHTRGGAFDLSPSAIIDLKSHGVSENVIMEVQRSSNSVAPRSVAPVYSSRTVVVAPAPPVYVVRPSARVGFYVGPRPRFGHYHHHHHHW